MLGQSFAVGAAEKTSPKGFSASKCDVRNWLFSKSWDVFWNILGFFGDFWEKFWEFFVGIF